MFSKDEIQDMCLLTPMQESMIYYKRRAESDNNHAYYQQIHCTLEGQLNIDRFRETVNHIVNKYDILRTAFLYKNVSKPVQIILKQRNIDVMYEDLTNSKINISKRLNNYKCEDKEKGFDLLKDPLVRISIFKESMNTFSIIFSFHHIILDGWSLSNLLSELKSVYTDLTLYNRITFKDVEPFTKFLKWQEKQDKDTALNFWKEYLDGYSKKASIFQKNQLEETDSNKYQKVVHIIGRDKTKKMGAIANRLGVTPASMFNTMWGIVLQKYNQTDDVVFANVTSGRTADIDGIEEIVGMFINSIPVRIRSEKDMSLKNLLLKINEESLIRTENSHVSLSEIQSLTEMKNNLIDNVVVFENYPFNKDMFESTDDRLRFTVKNFEVTGHSNYDFNLTIYSGEEIKLSANVNTTLYDPIYIENVLNSFERIADAMIEDLNQHVEEIDLLSGEHKDLLLEYSCFSNIQRTQREKDDATFNQLFETVVEKNQFRQAVSYKGRSITYDQLDKYANQLASRMIQSGCKPGNVIGVYAERSVEMIIATVAIIKAGGVYLPLNRYYPDEVLQNILEENKVQQILVYDDIQDTFKNEHHTKVVNISLENNELYSDQNVQCVPNINKSSSLLYMLYTSGTTGKPKGVAVEHNQLINTIRGLEEEIYRNYASHLRVGLVAPNFFDASIKQIFASLLLGHTLYIVDEETRFNGQKLLEYIINEQIEIIDGTPAHLKMMSAAIENSQEETLSGLFLKGMLVGGEKLIAEDARDFLHKYENDDFNLYNVYGLTECAVDTTTFKINRKNIDQFKQVPIGKPLQNQSVLILDKNQRLVPVGVEGEIYIGGKSVARGYIHDSTLQAERFVSLPDFDANLFYKTGDLGLWGDDGNILYRGRSDFQVNIRGYRIELQEIEHAIQGFDGIRDVVVLDVDKEDTEHLCAFFVAEESIDVYRLRNFLIEKLPQYMVPSFFSQIDQIPLKTNGKVDAIKLKKRVGDSHRIFDFVAPRNQTEAKLADLWKNTLKLNKAGVKDNFFSMGGHSLKAMELIMQIAKIFRVDISFKYFFGHPTIHELADYITRSQKSHIEINKVGKKDYYHVSTQQKRMYTFFKYDPNSTVYNIIDIYKIKGEINRLKFQNALNQLVERYEILRTIYDEVDGKVVQRVLDQTQLQIKHEKVEMFNAKKYSEITNKVVRPFNLNEEIPFEIHLVESPLNESVLILNMHHISFDGISISVFLEELFSLYLDKKLPPVSINYKDYAEWEIENVDRGRTQVLEEYWLEMFKGEIPTLNFPLDNARPPLRDYSGDHIDFELDQDTLAALKKITNETETTVYTVLYSLFNLLLYKYTGQKDIVTGTITSGRFHPDIKRALGMFVNTCAMRTSIDTNHNLETFFRNQRDTILEMFEYQDYSFEALIELLDIQSEKNRNPLFDVLFSMNNYDEFELPNSDKDLSIEPVEIEFPISKFDLALIGAEKKDTISFRLEYSNILFKRDSMVAFIDHFINLIKNSASGLRNQLSEIEIITKQERNLILNEFNATTTLYPREKTLKDLFEEQCVIKPDKKALVYNNQSMTYKALNERANQVARYLIDEGVKHETVVGISMIQGFDRVAAILGVIKAGGAFLPIDETYPDERIDFMLKDSNARIVVSDTSLTNLDYTGKVVNIQSQDIYKREISDVHTLSVSPESLAYIMYTSGSTGNPKGVMVEHKNVIRLVKETNYIDFLESDRILQGSTIVFDASTFEIWGALLNGIQLHLVDKETILHPEKLKRVIEKEDITIMWMTAPHFNVVSQGDPEIFKNLRYLLVGGDVLAPGPIEKVRKACKGVKLLNGYGPTENTTFSTIHPIEDKYSRNIPIGKPISNSTVYILDSHRQLQAIGAVGEIYVGGEGVTRGYLNNDELTEQKFVDNPFIPGERLYRTGDFGRWLSNGAVEYLGRADQQVKVRGFRIETGEIINTILDHPLVNEATVLIKENDESEKYIAAYVVLKQTNQSYLLNSIKQFVIDKLPEYMQPAFIFEVKKIPLTLNGKVDKKSLLSISESTVTEYHCETPSNRTEEKLLSVWKEVFGRNDIRTTDGFFDLGGNSLLAIKLLAKIKDEFGADVSIKELFVQSSIKNLANYIQNNQGVLLQKISKSTEKEFYAVTLAQERLYALSIVDEHNLAYNMPRVFIVKGNLDIQRLKESFMKLHERHEAFRTSFHTMKNKIVQKVNKYTEIDFEYVKLLNGNLQEQLQASIQPFNLRTAPLVRMKVIQYDETEYAVFIDMHHIVSDGESLNLFLEELFKLYSIDKDKKLEDIEIHQKDFAEWQKSLYEKPEMVEKELYWSEFINDFPLFTFPYDYLKPDNKKFNGATVECQLGEGSGQKIKDLAIAFECTPYVVLLTIFKIILSKNTQQENIVVGTSLNGRKYKEIQNTIGMFTRTVPLQASVHHDKTVEQLMKEVKEDIFNAIDHQEYETENLSDKIEASTDGPNNSLFNVVFTFDHKEKLPEYVEGLKMSEYPIRFDYSKFDLVFSVIEMDGEFSLNLQYNGDLFRDRTAHQIVTSFTNVFNRIQSNQTIGEIELITEEERKKILEDFNRTTVNYPFKNSLMDHIAESVRKFPDKNAAVFKNHVLTYKQLDDKAADLAVELMDRGIGKNDIVAILMESELDLLVAMLGTMKAGAAFLPIDPNYPDKRIQYLLEDSRSKLLITKRNWIKEFQPLTSYLLLDERLVNRKRKNIVFPSLQKTDLAYVIYTSGTSGKPKGVMVEHHALMNLCFWHNEQFDVSENDHASKYAGVGFDATIWEVFPYLIKGSTIYFIEDKDKLDTYRINEFFERNNITIGFLPTQIGEQFIKLKNDSLRMLLLGGDRLKEFIPKPYSIVNNYGPTENTVVTTSHFVEEKSANIPIGKPVANSKVYILDDNRKVVPIGLPGELCIAGKSLSAGYLYNPQLTAEKFVESPFDKFERMYRTGDIAKWNEDGTITFLGRKDNQIKIRGNRVEISEIEAALLGHEDIGSAIVVPKDDVQRDLVAYITTNKEIDVMELRNELKLDLPLFMVPSHIIVIDRFILNANGKIDLDKLPKVSGSKEIGNQPIRSRSSSAIEQQVYDMWSKVLNREDFNFDDDFFELGGDSLKWVYLLSDIREKMNLDCTFTEIYENSTLEAFAKVLETKQPVEISTDSYERLNDIYPLGTAQKRIFIVDYFKENSTLYNMPTIYEIKGQLDVDRVNKVMNQLVKRHESLRASFSFVDNEPVQKIQDEIEFQVDYIQLKNTDEKSLIQSLIKPFDLRTAPLIRTTVIEKTDGEFLLFLDMHHIVCDGVSLEVLLQEFLELYHGQTLPDLNRSYTDYISWQNHNYSTTSVIRQREFWSEKLAGYHNQDVLPVDFPRDKQEIVESNVVEFSLPSELHEQLTVLTKKFKCTISVLLTAIYAVLLHKYSNRNDIIVGCVSAGRQYPNVKQIVGMFTNTLPIRYSIDKELEFNEFLYSVNQEMMRAFDNQDFQFDDMIDTLNFDRVIGKTPLIDSLFQFQGLHLENRTYRHLQMEPYQVGVTSSKFDLEIYVQQKNHTLEFSINYRKSLFTEDTISNLVQDYQRLAESITCNPFTRIKNLDLLDSEEVEKNTENLFEIVDLDV
ncbi:amino acid adenylation domain-containing protein [Pseudalkalibacillus sp. SCS-8]|uniref:amino acid adenylation domain-containing protein n=1 Tax=Pseudalkalibacillus nanhaiensis TaxID=3115291 RepID=UPI0032DAB1B6